MSERNPPFIVENYHNREAWLKGRSKTIGASEVGVILGVSKWQSPFALWAKKRGIVSDGEPSSQQRWGWLMESAIGNWFQEETGWRVKFDGLRVLRSVQWPFLACSLDGLVMPGLAGIQFEGIDQIFHNEIPIDFKNCDSRVAHEWKERPPITYWCQLQMQMAVTGSEVAVIAVCIGGNEGRWFPVLRDQKFILRAIPRVEAFWRAVQEGVEPSVDGHETTRLALQEWFKPVVDDKRVEFGDEALGWVKQFDDAVKILAHAEAGKDEAANHIRRFIGDAVIGECPDGSGFTWKPHRTGGKRPLLRVAKVPRDLTEALNP